MKKQEILLLIDGNALVHRAFHALPPLTGPSGQVTNAIFGFSSILFRSIREINPEYIAATFDLASPTFRHEQFDDYKAKRAKAPQELYDQIPGVKRVLSALGIPIYEKQGFEADDLIGTIAKHQASKNIQVIIATGDLDTLQLVEGNRIVVLTLKKGMNDTVIYDEKAVIDRYGLKPEQLNDYRGLKGDQSDNIPGVPGIGEKTAAIIIGVFGTLEKLYENIERGTLTTERGVQTIKPKTLEKLIEYKDQAFFSRELSVIVTDVDTDFSLVNAKWKDHLSRIKVEELFKEFGFSSLIKRLADIDLGEQPALTMYEEPKSIDSTQLKQSDIGVLKESSFKNRHISLMINEDFLYLCSDEKLVYSLGMNDELWKKKLFHDLLTNSKIKVIGHDLKPIFKLLNKHEIHPINYFDTLLAQYISNEPMEDISISEIYRISKYLDSKITETDQHYVYYDIELPLIPVLASMETNGIKVDTDIIKDLEKKAKRALLLREKKIYSYASIEFNINSPVQLGEVLYDKLELGKKIRKTAKGARSTAIGELVKIREESPIVDLIIEYRELVKLKTTYIEPFLDWVVPSTSRVYTTYRQAGVATGRLSSQDPNLQNIPTRTELGQEFRKAFIAKRGYRLVSLDYSQIELRIAAHVAKDKTMIRAFKNNEDIHTRTAATIFGITPDQVTKEQRRTAKVLNFGIMYGFGVMGFARSAGMKRDQAREFMDTYFVEFNGFAKYMEETKLFAHKHGYAQSLFGHRRYLPDIKSTMRQLQASAERMAINMPMQGTNADIMKLAMIKIHDYIALKGEDVFMLLQIHDELVFEIKIDKVDKISKEIKSIMENIYKFDVSLVVDVKIGNNWGEMK